MAGTLRNGPRLNILNNDGQPHPAENISAILVLALGLISFVLGLIVRNVHTGPAVHITAADYLVSGEDDTAFEAEEASMGVEAPGVETTGREVDE